MRRRKRPAGVPFRKQVLYTVYRAKDDEIICFEEPAERAAAILGISRQRLYEKVWAQTSPRYKSHRLIIERTRIAEMPLDAED